MTLSGATGVVLAAWSRCDRRRRIFQLRKALNRRNFLSVSVTLNLDYPTLSQPTDFSEEPHFSTGNFLMYGNRLKSNRPTILIVIFIFILGFALRVVFAPKENISADPFSILASAKTLAETGKYLLPDVGFADLKVRYTKLTGWPVGFPLMLSSIFRVFGYSEYLARLFTIFLGSLNIIFIAIIANLFFQKTVAYVACFLMAIHPLLVAFNGRIFTNNPALLFFISSITFMLLGIIERGRELQFVGPSAIIADKKRFLSFVMSFALLGFSLTIREYQVMFIPVYLYLLYKAGFFRLHSDS